jgi:hypothetical protein
MSAVLIPARRSVRGEVSAAIWLKWRDLARIAGRPKLGPVLAISYALFVITLCVGGLLAHSAHRNIAIGTLLTPIWLLWALLPAVGAGGGSLDSSMALAPYPVGVSTQLASSWISALLDIQYLVPVPAVLAAGAIDYGPSGLVLGFAFIAGASALGQLATWLSVSGLRARRGQSLVVTGVAVVVLAGIVLARRHAGAHKIGTIPPTHWLSTGAHALNDGNVAVAAGLWLLLAAPVIVLVLAGPYLVRRATIARLASPGSHGHGHQLPASTPMALAAAAWRGIARTLSWRATLFAVVAVPFLTTLLTHPMTFRSLASVVLVSAGATLAANTWSYESGGVTALLSAPVPRRTIVVVRSGVLACALAATLALATAAALVAGPLRARTADIGYIVCILIVITVAGMRTAVASPSAADLDALRARPATLGAVMAFSGRCLVGCAAIAALWPQGIIGASIATAGTFGYAAWALRGTARRMADGASLLAAFATVR